MGMPMKPTLVHLPESMIERLDEKAVRRDRSRSQVVRDAIARYLADDAELDRAVRVAYEREPLDTPDEWGDLESFLTAGRQERGESG